ncbi:unnamed protein product [Withania somnifera]
MNPQASVRLSIGSLGLRVPGTDLNGARSGRSALSFPCACEILSSPESTPDSNDTASSFYLQKSDLKALLAPGCLLKHHACLEVVVFTVRNERHCGVGIKRQQIGTIKLEVGPEWGEEKPIILFNGWIHIGKNKVKLDPDPRYIFQFEDKTKLSPQIVQLQGTIKQPIFSCKFSQDQYRYLHKTHSVTSGLALLMSLNSILEKERGKGGNVKIHDLSGSAVAAAFITTPFVPSTGRDWVARSNPGACLIVHSDVFRPDSWQQWGKLEPWRESGIRDSICCRFHILTEGQESWDLLMSEILINTDRQVRAASSPLHSPRGSRDFALLSPGAGRFFMSCRVQGEGKCSKPLVQLALRHVTCVEDVAIFMALAAAVDLSIEACCHDPQIGL